MTTKAEQIETMFSSIIPEGLYGEQYKDDVALIFKPEKALFSETTKYQKIDVIETESYGKIMFIDNLLMKTDVDGWIINEFIVHPAMRTGPEKKRVLVIGGGEGWTATELLKYPNIEKIDIVDIDGEAVELYKKIYPEKMACLNDARVEMIIADGLEYLKTTDQVYDVILTTPTDPLTISDPLFIEDYYKNAHRCLTDDGIFQTDAYMPHYNYGPVDYAYIQHHMGKQFPISRIYTTTIPTFPGGMFCFGFASKKYDPLKDFNRDVKGIETGYFDDDIHYASFVLPKFMREKIENYQS